MTPLRPACATFGCEISELDDEVLVTVTGDLDITVSSEFRRNLDDAARPGKSLFLDLTAVTFIGGECYRAIAAVATALPVTAVTRSPLTATVLRLTPGTTLRVRLS